MTVSPDAPFAHLSQLEEYPITQSVSSSRRSDARHGGHQAGDKGSTYVKLAL
jgi:hypothetical protein